jgi:hypothetical protein
MAYIKTPKNAKKYVCEKCDFICSKQSDYNRHLLTAKHKQAYNGLQIAYSKIPPCETIDEKLYDCACGMVYNHRQSLYRHQKKCQKMSKNADTSPPPENRIVHEPISESMVIKCFQMMMETQAERDAQTAEAQAVRDAAHAERDDARDAAHAAAAAEQTRLLIEAINCGTEFPPPKKTSNSKVPQGN